MDRCRALAILSLVVFTTGCSTSQSFLSKTSGGWLSKTSGCGAGDCPIGCAEEPCEPLLANGCSDGQCAEGCSGATEGCGGSAKFGSRINGRYSGLEGGFERGKDNILLDGAGWVMGIPSKLLLWNTKVDSHSVSPEVEHQLRQYMTERGLTDVKVRINQYDPIGEWRRLLGNKSIHPAFKYTVGAYANLKYTMVPGRLFGADEYNPFTNSINLYSDRASLALREGAHAKQAIESGYRGLYASSMYIPGSPLWVDTTATREVLAYTKESGDRLLQRETYLVLFPAYGSRIGSSATFFLDAGVGQAAQASLALVGHAVGRTMAFRVSEGPVEMVKSVYGIVRKPEDAGEEVPVAVQEELEPVPAQDIFPVHFVPMDVQYDATK